MSSQLLKDMRSIHYEEKPTPKPKCPLRTLCTSNAPDMNPLQIRTCNWNNDMQVPLLLWIQPGNIFELKDFRVLSAVSLWSPGNPVPKAEKYTAPLIHSVPVTRNPVK